MADHGNLRRRWMRAFSSNVLLSGVEATAQPNRRLSTDWSPDWTLVENWSSAPRMASAGRRPTASVLVPTAIADDVDRRVVIEEEIFRGVMIREHRRADRFQEPFVVLLVAHNQASSPYDASIWRHAESAVLATTRETDIVGWVTQGKVLAVILTEIRAGDKRRARGIETRLRTELAGRLDSVTLKRLSVRLHFNQPSRHGVENDLWPADPLLFSPNPDPDGLKLADVLKRGLDILGSIVLLTVLAPVFLLIAALIKLKSPGPVLFRQVRVGRKARPFTMLKFRSMQVNADSTVHQAYVTQFIQSGGQWQTDENTVIKLTNDSRITPLGHFLRRTSLDELPQLWNVLRGDMSLVGPRPSLYYEIEQYQPWHWRRVVDAKPGLTGLWQVTGRSRTTFDGMVRLDLRYLKKRSLWTDIKILLATPAAVISGKGAC